MQVFKNNMMNDKQHQQHDELTTQLRTWQTNNTINNTLNQQQD
jgi:hypothetical protein